MEGEDFFTGARLPARNTSNGTSGLKKSPGCLVDVEESYPYKFLFPFLPKSTWTIASTSQMVVLQ
jgi:hypothetical protein